MEVTWDEAKRLADLDKHGLDFVDFEDGFDFARAIEVPAYPSRMGRQRRALIGELHGQIVVAIVSSLGSEALSLISLRPANQKERGGYGF